MLTSIIWALHFGQAGRSNATVMRHQGLNRELIRGYAKGKVGTSPAGLRPAGFPSSSARPCSGGAENRSTGNKFQSGILDPNYIGKTWGTGHAASHEVIDIQY
jgi:hypothetical protein